MQTERKTNSFSQCVLTFYLSDCMFLLHLRSNGPTCLVFTFCSMAWWILKCALLKSVCIWENVFNWTAGLLFRLRDCDAWNCDCLPPIYWGKCSLVVFCLGQCLCVLEEERTLKKKDFFYAWNEPVFVLRNLFERLNRFCLRLKSYKTIKM